MLRSPLTNPMTTPMINPIRTGISEITRAILNFNGTQYATLSEDIEFPDEFRVEALVYFGDCPDGHSVRLWGNEAEYGLGFLSYSRESGNLVVRDANAWIQVANLSLDYSIHRITVSRPSGSSTITIEVNGVPVGSYSSGALYRIRYLMRAYGSDISTWGNQADSTLFSFSAWSTEIPDTDSLNASYRFDQPDTIYQRNYASSITDPNDPNWSGAILQNVLPGDWETVTKKEGDDYWLGEENVFSADVVAGFWQVLPGNVYTIDGTQTSNNDITTDSAMTVGGTYIFTGLCENIVGTFAFRAGPNEILLIESDGFFEAELTAEIVDIVLRAQPGSSGTFSKLSVRRKFQYAEGAL